MRDGGVAILDDMTTTPAPTLEELTAREALDLMARVPVGRVVFTEGALPAIRPVWFVLESGTIVFRIIADERLASALHNSVVAFQADDYDAIRQTGWSVTVTGHATRVDDPPEVERLTRTLPPPWTDVHHVFQVEPELVTGHRLTTTPGARTTTIGS